MGISNLTSKSVKNVKESVVSDHLLQCNCAIDFDHFDVLASDTNSFRLLIKESLLIKHDKPVLNRTDFFHQKSGEKFAFMNFVTVTVTRYFLIL